MSPVDPRTELLLGGTWTDVTGWVYERDPIAISGRGRSSEQGASLEPTELSLTLNNRDGRFSPRNPMSPYYGQIGRNTPIRVSVPHPGGTALLMPGDLAATVRTGDHSSLDITGDIDIRVQADLETWRAQMPLAARWDSGTSSRSWAWHLLGDGRMRLLWTTSGGLGTVQLAVSTAAVPVTRGLTAVRVTLDSDNGAGGWTATFYHGTAVSGQPWTQLGDPVTGTGTTSIHAGDADVEAGSALYLQPDVSSYIHPLLGRVHAFQLRSGITGTIVANPDFTAADPGDAVVIDSAGRSWLVSDPAEITDRDYRVHAEVSSWPQRWDVSGRDVYTPIAAAGITRRLGQGDAPLSSTLYRGLTSGDTDTPVEYWPCEDGQDSTQLASALEGGQALTVQVEQPDYAAFDTFACSRPLPTFTNSQWYGPVRSYVSPTGQHQARFLLYLKAGVNGERVFTVYMSGGSLQRAALHYGTGGTLDLQLYTWDGTMVASTTPVNFQIDEKLLRISIELTQDGGDVDATISTVQVGATSGLFVTITAAGQSIGRISGVGTNAGGGLTADTAVIGHISVHATITSLFDLVAQLNAYAGERAGDRLARLCAEQNVPFSLLGDAAETELMGPQRPNAFLDLVDECAAADLGILYEPRWRLGLAYRTRASLYNQTPALELEYGQDRELGGLDPVDDDAQTRNAVTVSRDGGSSATAVLETGALSIRDPDDGGVGRYEDSVTLNVYTDAQLRDQAGWRLHLGTVDEARYPSIPLTLRSSVYTTPALVQAARALDIGGRLTVSEPPPWLPPEDIDQLTLGLAETITTHTHTAVVNAAPYSPYRVGVLDDPVLGRAGTAGSQLAASIGPTDTTLLVATTSGPEWVWEPSVELPFLIRVGGEVMQVTAVSGPTWSFEENANGWAGTDATFGRSTTRAWSGTASGVLIATGTGAVQAIARPTSTHRAYVTPGVSYNASMWAYHTGGYSSVAIAIDWFTSGGAYITTNAASKAIPANTWTYYTIAATAPATAARASYGPTLGGTPGAGTAIWADHISVTPIERQTLTVVRGINGIAKSHPSGSAVQLDQSMILSL